MKDFICNCLLFQSGDKEITIIGIVMWLTLFAIAAVLFYPQIL